MNTVVVSAIAGYLIGSFPTGVVLTRRKYGIDVREMGSGNIGATNVTRVFGWYAGALVFLVDFLKGLLPLLLVKRYYPEDLWALAAGGSALVLGHCFSAYLKLRGGKGVATSLGCLVAVVPLLAGIAAAAYAVVLAITRISALGSLTGILVVLGYLAFFRPPAPVTCLILFIAVIVVVRHRQNIERLWAESRARRDRNSA